MKQRNPSTTRSELLIAEARRRATLLKDIPREELVKRFVELVEEIRQEAIEKGTALDET